MADIPDEQAALLVAIVANPDDDTPRLVYADWLQEHGDEEQARFIRDSIALEWLEDYEDDKRQTIAMRLDKIEHRNGLRWLNAVGVRATDVAYDRGMVEGVVYNGASAFWEDAAVLFTRAPIRDLTIHNMIASDLDPDWLDVMADVSHFARLRVLRLSNSGWPVTSSGWERFITSPHLANLEELSVRSAGLTDNDMALFDRCEHLVNLEELYLAGNGLTAEGALAVVRSPRLPRLRRLSLANNDIVADRRRGSAYLALIDALHERFDGTHAL
ncbi:TIGR02996 domain-containing protein [Frigoriglobus tundricola]|uniref:Repeat-companion domain protein n=1 Tax=Frigoriglobus tundricola TaxID=2774151 RepID=A0A6M5YJ94_9BACT|nr:TIGR02996 domain-containing protein [Frigoriglobus tundricola]QJW93411.1 hypothetical protein FTUN_0917 [Frigoriglobus tundricola]